MKTMNKHTPAPWRIDGDLIRADVVHPETGTVIAVKTICRLAPLVESTRDEQIANGQFILKAANSHRKLVAVPSHAVDLLRRLLRAYDTKQMTPANKYAPLWSGVRALVEKL